MKDRRNPSTTRTPPKVTTIIFIAVLILVARLNLARISRSENGIPQDRTWSEQAEEIDQGIVGYLFSQEPVLVEDKYHVVVSIGEGIYTEWQVRVVSKSNTFY